MTKSEWYRENDYKKVLKNYLWKRIHHSWHLNPINLPPEIGIGKRQNLKGQKINKRLTPSHYIELGMMRMYKLRWEKY